jgi:Cdc6-like AAA superfamily ATPase
MPHNVAITEDVLSRFSALKAEIVKEFVRGYDFADVVKVDASTLFQGQHRQFLLVVVDWAHVEEALSLHRTWLTTLIYECISYPSVVVPLVLGGKQGPVNHAEMIRRHGGEGVQWQPIIEYRTIDKTKSAKEMIREAIINSEVRFKVNPYNVNVTAVGEMFFGRKEELYNIQSARGHVFIVGARRIGKTSLVTKLVDSLNREPQYGRIELGGLVVRKAAQLDVSKLGADIGTAIWENILDKFGLTKERWRLYSRKLSLSRKKAVEDPSLVLERLIKRAPGKLTIVLDEMDGWIKKEASSHWPTIDRIRALTDEGRAKLILVGYEMFRRALKNDTFPLFSKGTLISLGPIDRSTLTDLVKKPMSDFDVQLEGEDIVTNIWKKTAGMPHVVQDVCNILLSDCLKERRKIITLRHVSHAFRKSDKYEEFQRGVINCPFPLAEAIAGVVAFVGNGNAVETKDILAQLERFDYCFNGDEFDLALDYLVLRFALVVAGEFRNSWRMFHESQQKFMYYYIDGKGFDNWLSSLVKKHNQGTWKQYYENLL